MFYISVGRLPLHIIQVSFRCKVVTKNGQVFDNVERAVRFNQHHKTVEWMPSIAKKRFLRKKYKRHLLSSFQETISTRTSGSVFADRIKQGKKTNIEVELIKIGDCFLDGYGTVIMKVIYYLLKLNLCKLTTVFFNKMRLVEVDRKSHHDNK